MQHAKSSQANLKNKQTNIKKNTSLHPNYWKPSQTACLWEYYCSRSITGTPRSLHSKLLAKISEYENVNPNKHRHREKADDGLREEFAASLLCWLNWPTESYWAGQMALEAEGTENNPSRWSTFHFRAALHLYRPPLLSATIKNVTCLCLLSARWI